MPSDDIQEFNFNLEGNHCMLPRLHLNILTHSVQVPISINDNHIRRSINVCLVNEETDRMLIFIQQPRLMQIVQLLQIVHRYRARLLRSSTLVQSIIACLRLGPQIKYQIKIAIMFLGHPIVPFVKDLILNRFHITT